jgi:cell division protein FtsQ
VTLWTVRDLLLGSERFRLAEGERGLVVTGAERIDELDLRKLFAGDHGKSLLEIPMAERQAAVVETAWVSRARVVRLWPNRIWVDVVERRPVAYVRVEEGGGSLRVKLIDSEGVLLEPIAGAQLELPILDGIDRSMARPEREKRIRLFERMMAELDSEEPQLSGRVSQVDVSDPKNAKVVVLHEGDVIELELGDELFRHRFEIFSTGRSDRSI